MRKNMIYYICERFAELFLGFFFVFNGLYYMMQYVYG